MFIAALFKIAKVEEIQMLIDRQVNKQSVAYTNNKILSNLKKKENSGTTCNIDALRTSW